MDDGTHAPSVTLEDTTVIREIRIGLGLRKERLEKLKKAAKADGISTENIDERLALHDARGIPALFADDHDGTMFAPVWPLKSIDDDPEVGDIVLPSEDEAITWIMAFLVGMIDEDPKVPASEKPLPEMRWLDKNGRIFVLALGTSLGVRLAPRPPLTIVDGGLDEDDGQPAPPPADEQRVSLARIAIKDETSLTVQARTKTLEYLDSLEGDELDRFVDIWLDSETGVADRPKAPDIWPPVDTVVPYDTVLQDWLDGPERGDTGGKISKTARELAIAREVPPRYFDLPGTGSDGKLLMADVEDAINRWVSDTGTTEAETLTALHAITIGKGKKPHLAVTDPDAGSYYIDHAMCGRDMGSGPNAVNLTNGLDDVCVNCVKTYEAGRTSQGGNRFEVAGA